MATTVLTYGRSGSGKTTQIGKLAEHVFATTGKKTRLASSDRGGLDPVQPYIELGIIEPVHILDSDPWIYLNKVVRGWKRDASGKWVLDQAANDNIGLWAFESMRSIGELLMSDMAKKAAQNINIGGGANVSFNVQGDGESLKISGSNMAHYGVAQTRITDEVWESQKLPGNYVLWTSSVSKDADELSSSKVLGPDVVGKALTTEVPRWFHYSMRIDTIPAQQGKPERHLLYLGTHVDQQAGNAAGLGNMRRPLDAAPMTTTIVEPADIVVALKMLQDDAQKTAKAAIAKRLGIKA